MHSLPMDCNILRRKMLSSRIKGICTAENGVAAIGESKTSFGSETGFYVISVLKIALRNNAIIKSRAQKFGGHKTVDSHGSLNQTAVAVLVFFPSM